MKILTNSIGNYTYNRAAAEVNHQSFDKNLNAETIISNKEKVFFTKLYPAKTDEIIKYHFYNKNGELSGVAVGKNVNRRM